VAAAAAAAVAAEAAHGTKRITSRCWQRTPPRSQLRWLTAGFHDLRVRVKGQGLRVYKGPVCNVQKIPFALCQLREINPSGRKGPRIWIWGLFHLLWALCMDFYPKSIYSRAGGLFQGSTVYQ
jgi:hypothetical protein